MHEQAWASGSREGSGVASVARGTRAGSLAWVQNVDRPRIHSREAVLLGESLMACADVQGNGSPIV